MSGIGNNVSLSFDGTSLTGIKSVEESSDVAMAVSQYAGQAHDKNFAGTHNTTLTVNFEIAATDVTLLGTTLARGNTGAVEYYPFGNTATYIKITSTNGTIGASSFSTPVNGIIAGNVTIHLDDYTIEAAA